MDVLLPKSKLVHIIDYTRRGLHKLNNSSLLIYNDSDSHDVNIKVPPPLGNGDEWSSET